MEAAPEFLQLLDTPDTASLGPEPRPGRKSVEEIEASLSPIFAAGRYSSTTAGLIRSLVLLWHDHLDESHEISQNFSSPDGSYVHGIMHRREPDYSNAKYWFHRMGWHPIFPKIAKCAKGTDKTNEEKRILSTVITVGVTAADEWDPFAFIDACQRARQTAPAEAEYLRKLQVMEFAILLKHFIEQK